MQTFLPYPDFTESAARLDSRRLGKQRAETIQVLRGLVVPGYGWRRHPAVAMWAGYEEALVRYGLAVCEAWLLRGHADTTAATLLVDMERTTGLIGAREQAVLADEGELPPWLGDRDFHLSHRSALIRKDPAFYLPQFGDVPDNVPYVWPASDRERRVPLDAGA